MWEIRPRTQTTNFHFTEFKSWEEMTFDRDLYMPINNLTVMHDTRQFALRDPFLIHEDIPTLREVPIDYFTTILEEEDGPKDQGKKKS